MATNKRPRKKYRPRPQLVNPVAWVIEGTRPLVEHKPSELLTARIKNSDALLRVMQGEADRETIDLLVGVLNAGLALQNTSGIGADWRKEFEEASDALLSLCRRGVANGDRFIFTGPELNAVRTMMEVHDAQLDACTLAQFDRALVMAVEAHRRGPHAKALEWASEPQETA